MSLLSDALRTHLIPWSRSNVDERLIVARSKMSMRQMPAGVRLSICSHMGPRIIVKKSRSYRNTRNTSAAWPETQLNEVAHYKLVCVLDGHVNFQLNNTLLQCGPGHFILIPPGIPHPMSAFPFIDTTMGTSCDILYFALYDDALQCWINRCRVGQRILTESNTLFTDEHATALLRILMKEAFSGETNSLDICGQLLPILLQLLQRDIEAGRFQTLRGDNADDYSAPESAKTQGVGFAARLERYVQSNLHKPLTLESVAQEMYLSRSQFALTVRRETGQTFNQLLVAHRIEAAKGLLRDSPWTVAAIAGFVGFKSPSYFRTFFHTHTGQTPTEFRELANKVNLIE
jgi:AraC-like DNA-binding protein